MVDIWLKNGGTAPDMFSNVLPLIQLGYCRHYLGGGTDSVVSHTSSRKDTAGERGSKTQRGKEGWLVESFEEDSYPGEHGI